MAALIGALRVSLSADTAKFEAGMKRAQRTANTASSGINKSLGLLKSGLVGFASGLSIGLLVRGIKGALDYAGSLAEVAQQLGVTTKDLQVFRFAAGQVGVAQSELEKGLSKLRITLGAVALGAKAPTEALEGLQKGLSKTVQGMDVGDAFRAISDALSTVTDSTKRAKIEMLLFGRAGAQLDNLLAGGSGALNELASAAERLGIVLSDEQIAKADQTADKLDAIKTVLAARIAGVVADNSDAILGLANALAEVASAAARAFGAMSNFAGGIQRNAPAILDAISKVIPGLSLLVQTMQLLGSLGGDGNVRGLNKAGKSVTVTLPGTKNPPVKGRNIGQFLAPSGGGAKKGRKGATDNTAEDALRDAFQFDQQIRRAQMDVLRATQDLATDYVERASLAIQLLDMEKAAQDKELEYEVALNKLTKGKEGLSEVQAAQLQLEYDRKDQLERDKILADEQAQRREDVTHLIELDADLERDILESQTQLAETSGEQRNAQLRLLDLIYRQERARLEAVLADEKSSELAKEEARRRLDALSQTQANDQQAVIQGTRGPWEEFANAATDAKKLEEAFQSVAVNGVGALTDGLLAAIDGTKSLGEAFRDVAQSIIQDLLRIMIQKLIVQAIGGAGLGFSSGGYTGEGFASGGFTGMGGLGKIAGVVHAREFVLNAQATSRLGVPALNALNSGAPMSAVSNDNHSNMGGEFIFNNYAKMTEREARQTGMQAAAAFKTEMARSSRQGF